MGLINTLKKNDSLTFDLIQNASGVEHYKDEFIIIEIDNIESESKTGYYEGVELNILSGDVIKNFENFNILNNNLILQCPSTKISCK